MGLNELNISSARYRSNLNSIRTIFPTIYQALQEHSTISMNNVELNEFCLKAIGVEKFKELKETIDSKTSAMILNVDRELSQTDIGAFNLPGPDLYEYPRLFMRAIDLLVTELKNCTTPNDKAELNRYRCLTEKALIVLYGTPTAEGLQHLIARYRILNLIIICPCIDEFITSLIAEKWFTIIQEVNNNSVALQILLSDSNNPNLEFGLTWNELIKKNPFFPLQTFYINLDDNRQNSYNALIHQVQKDMNIYFSGWGNYDDEVNQIKQTIFNAHHILRILNVQRSTQTDLPVIIIGSGPSLDKSIDIIKSVDRKCLLISCATALTALYKNGITPDIHIETESDYVRINMFENIDDPNYLKKISLIAPIQISPAVSHYFEKHIVYGIENQPLSHILKTAVPIIKTIGTNCLNHAIHIANLVGFKKIFLIGFDLGFFHSSQHHSEQTIYYDENAHQLFKDGAGYKGRILRNILSFDGKQMLTDPFMDAARIYLERYLDQNVHLTVYNLSQGGLIQGVEDISANEFQTHFVTSKYDCTHVIQVLESISIDVDQTLVSFIMNTILNEKIPLVQELRNAVLDITRLLKVQKYPFNDRMLCLLNTINHYLEVDLKKRCYPVYKLIRGSYYHLMTVGFSYYLTLSRIRASDQYLFDLWSNHVYQFGKNMTVHFSQALLEEDLEDITLFNRSLSEPERAFRQ